MGATVSASVYTLEAGGKVLLSFKASNHLEAQRLLMEEWLRSDLKELKSGGRPLWDGKANLTVRIADGAEAARFEREVKSLPPASDGSDLPMVYHVALY